MKNRHYNSNIGTRGLVLGLLTLLVGALLLEQVGSLGKFHGDLLVEGSGHGIQV